MASVLRMLLVSLKMKTPSPFEDEHENEDRFITIGRDFLSRILVVVYTFRDIVIRIISARKATARERKIYEEQNEE